MQIHFKFAIVLVQIQADTQVPIIYNIDYIDNIYRFVRK